MKGEGVVYVKGRSDFADHPVYQTKWAKFGLRALGLPDPYVIPVVPDSYSSLFWMDYRDRHVVGVEAADRGFYPYLGWATDHFQRVKKSPISDQDYPLTWEIQASQADYRGMAAIDPVFVKQKTSVPHTWHAAEVFLYLLDEPDRSSPAATTNGASTSSMFTNPVAARGADPWVVLWKNNYYLDRRRWARSEVMGEEIRTCLLAHERCLWPRPLLVCEIAGRCRRLDHLP